MPETDDRAIFTHELHIDASADTVYSYFTDPTEMAAWMGVDHKLDPIPGGAFRVDINGRDVAVGQFVRLEPPTYLVFTRGWEGSADLPTGTTTIEVRLTRSGNGTKMTLTHSGLPTSRVPSHTKGWHHYLGRLQIVGGGGPAEPDPWVHGENQS